MSWSPTAWRDKPARQLPAYPDAAALAAAETELHAMPPLIFAGEARALKAHLASVAVGRAFLLLGGDCADPSASSTPTRCVTRSRCCCKWRWC